VSHSYPNSKPVTRAAIPAEFDTQDLSRSDRECELHREFPQRFRHATGHAAGHCAHRALLEDGYADL
jgi:hypothetical protein